MKLICAANWKMNLSYSEAEVFMTHFMKDYDENKRNHFCFFPQALHTSLFKQKKINWGAQDFYFENSGAFTGQNSPELYKELGASTMLIGHSERRQFFGETNEAIKKKINKTIELGLVPMLCIGETKAQRESGQTLAILSEQLDAAFDTKPKSLLVAYEPVWAIGTGLTAKPSDIKEAHDFIKEKLGPETLVLYGGSVKPSNAGEIFSVASVDGFLIGGASLDPKSFLEIYQQALAVQKKD